MGAHFATEAAILRATFSTDVRVLEETSRTVVGVLFDLKIAGISLTPLDRIRIVDYAVNCGGPGASENTLGLRGPLSRTPDSTGDWLAANSTTTANGSLAAYEPSLQWEGLRMTTPGLRRICWCTDCGGTSICSADSDFSVDVGLFVAVDIQRAWVDACARARKPFRVHVAAVGLRPEVDRVMIARSTDVCDQASPAALSPAGIHTSGFAVNTHPFGFAALQCFEDPNAFGVPEERKMVCGDRRSSILVREPGLYRACLCVRLPTADCTHPRHFRVPAGDAFELRGPDGPADTSAEGGAAPPPLILNGHNGLVLAMAYASEVMSEQAPRRLATASEDRTIRLWEPSIPRGVAELVGHTARIDALAWAPDATWFVSGSPDSTLRLWGQTSGVAPGQEAEHECPTWQPVWERVGHNWCKGSWYPTSHEECIVFDSTDFDWQMAILGHLIDMPADVLLRDNRAFGQDAPSFLDLTDRPRLTLQLAAGQCEKACGVFRERAAAMCDCGPSMECHLVHNCVPKCGLEDYIWWRAHQMRITAVAVSPDSTLVASASTDRTVRLWDAREGFRSQTPLSELHGHGLGVLTVAFFPGPDSGILVSGGDDARILWHNTTLAAADAAAFSLIDSFENPVGAGESVLSVVFSADGRFFAAAGANRAALWDAVTRVKLRDLVSASFSESSLGSEMVPMATLAFADDGGWLALRSPPAVLVWPMDAGQGISGGNWASFTSEDLEVTTLTWSDWPGPQGNTPQHGVSRHGSSSTSDGTFALHFSPCNITAGCSGHLPMVRLDIEVPFEFTAVSGSFVEYSVGQNRADDCRGGTPHNSWEDRSAAQSYWTLSGTDVVASSEDCEMVGPVLSAGRASIYDCQNLCVAHPVCNVINFRVHPPNCDLRRCLDATQPILTESLDHVVWANIIRLEREELIDPPHDGYVMFGAPNATGGGGLVYGGCGAGPDMPEHGVVIQIPEQVVPRTRMLRWQVVQSRHTEALGIRNVQLRLLRPDAGRRALETDAASGALAWAAAGRRELAAGLGPSGKVAVWDLRGADLPRGRDEEFKLKSVFNFSLELSELRESDRVRIVDASNVPACGALMSSSVSQAVQGLGAGRRTAGDTEMSLWDGLAATQPMDYRVCFCGGRPQGCCDSDGDFNWQIMTFIVAGVSGGHYFVCEHTLDIDCTLTPIRGIGLQVGDVIMLQNASACGMATSFVPDLPGNGIIESRLDYGAAPESGGSWYRYETPNWAGQPLNANLRDIPAGMTVRLCWCGRLAACNTSMPSEFRTDAGLLTIAKFNARAEMSCNIGSTCTVILETERNSPLALGDVLMVKRPPEGAVVNGRVRRRVGLACQGDVITTMGREQNGISDRLYFEDGSAVFEFGRVTAEAGLFRLCWCQGSIRQCLDPAEFTFDAGSLEIKDDDMVWPDCTLTARPFIGWRAPYATFDDCCCNIAEAGGVGCANVESEAYMRCAELPLR